jgi:hypothetical protein
MSQRLKLTTAETTVVKGGESKTPMGIVSCRPARLPAHWEADDQLLTMISDSTLKYSPHLTDVDEFCEINTFQEAEVSKVLCVPSNKQTVTLSGDRYAVANSKGVEVFCSQTKAKLKSIELFDDEKAYILEKFKVSTDGNYMLLLVIESHMLKRQVSLTNVVVINVNQQENLLVKPYQVMRFSDPILLIDVELSRPNQLALAYNSRDSQGGSGIRLVDFNFAEKTFVKHPNRLFDALNIERLMITPDFRSWAILSSSKESADFDLSACKFKDEKGTMVASRRLIAKVNDLEDGKPLLLCDSVVFPDANDGNQTMLEYHFDTEKTDPVPLDFSPFKNARPLEILPHFQLGVVAHDEKGQVLLVCEMHSVKQFLKRKIEEHGAAVQKHAADLEPIVPILPRPLRYLISSYAASGLGIFEAPPERLLLTDETAEQGVSLKINPAGSV